MKLEEKTILRKLIQNLLINHGDHNDFTEEESLFISGRLDSLSMVTLIMHLEKNFGINFSDEDFDIERIDTQNDIEKLLSRS